MSLRIQTATAQPTSAQRVVSAAGIKHDDRAQGELTVGVTAGGGVRQQRLHFCSSRLVDVRIEYFGDGQPVPQHPEYPVVIVGGLPQVPADGLLRFRANIHANGSLNIMQRGRAKFVPVPQSMDEQAPYAHADGPNDMAHAYGCSSVEEMFQQFGQEVFVS